MGQDDRRAEKGETVGKNVARVQLAWCWRFFPSSLQVVEFSGVVAHQFCLQRVGQILALHHFFDGVGKLGVAMVVVGGEDQALGADELANEIIDR